MSNATLIEELKVLIIESLNLEDALELGLALKKKYGITLTAESDDNKKHFASVAALADFVETTRA